MIVDCIRRYNVYIVHHQINCISNHMINKFNASSYLKEKKIKWLTKGRKIVTFNPLQQEILMFSS